MGATYVKNHHGSASVELGEVLEEMQNQQQIEAVKSWYFKFPQKKYLSLKRPDLDNFPAGKLLILTMF